MSEAIWGFSGAIIGAIVGGTITAVAAWRIAAKQRDADRAAQHVEATRVASAEFLGEAARASTLAALWITKGLTPLLGPRSAFYFAVEFAKIAGDLLRAHTALYLSADDQLMTLADDVLERVLQISQAMPDPPGLEERQRLSSELEDATRAFRRDARRFGDLPPLAHGDSATSG